MASLTIRDLDAAVKQGLRRRAAERGVSMEEARAVLRAAALAPPGPREGGRLVPFTDWPDDADDGADDERARPR